MIKPILFNTDMVRAILDNIKVCTRRNIKGYIPNDAVWGYSAFTPKGCISCRGIYEDGYGEKFFKLPCEKGDILYVRETWCWCPCWDCGMDTEEGCCDKTAEKFYNHSKGEMGCYGYKASFEDGEQPFDRWYPSIHMPKEAARNDVFEQYIHKELEEDNYLSCDYINAFWNARAVYKEKKKKFTKKEKEIKQYISQLEALKYTPNKELYKIFQCWSKDLVS